MDSWWVAFSRCGKFLLSDVTPKVLELERRSFAQIEAHEKTVSEFIFCDKKPRYHALKLVLMFRIMVGLKNGFKRLFALRYN